MTATQSNVLGLAGMQLSPSPAGMPAGRAASLQKVRTLGQSLAMPSGWEAEKGARQALHEGVWAASSETPGSTCSWPS